MSSEWLAASIALSTASRPSSGSTINLRFFLLLITFKRKWALWRSADHLFLSKRRHRIDARRSPCRNNTGHHRDGSKQNRYSGERQWIDGVCRKEHRLNESGQANRPA